MYITSFAGMDLKPLGPLKRFWTFEKDLGFIWSSEHWGGFIAIPCMWRIGRQQESPDEDKNGKKNMGIG